MNPSKLKITGYSTALFSTWYFIEELGVLFDAGDGLTSSLLQKSRKIRYVFISHADRDHITGIFQLNQLNARENYPVFFYPKNSGSFPAIENFTLKFDPHSIGAQWVPVKENQEIQIKDRIVVSVLRNSHIEAPYEITKSLSFKVLNKKSKLKNEFKNLSPDELKRLSSEKGKDYITRVEKTCLLGYSGDTPVEDYERWDNTNILIHEATFLNGEDGKKNHANKHSNLKEVLKMVSEINIERLILGHFSTRYSNEQIDEAIKRLTKAFNIKIPIYRVLPGQTNFNILNDNPVN